MVETHPFPPAVWSRDNKARMRAAALPYSKSMGKQRHRIFTEDADKKQQVATPAMRTWAAEYLDPLQRRLDAAFRAERSAAGAA